MAWTLSTKTVLFGHTGSKDTSPHYVVKKDGRNNELIVAQKNEAGFGASKIKLKNLNLSRKKGEQEVLVRVRYRQPLTKATLKTNSKNSATLELEKPQQFIATGQSAVFYSRKGELLGGGVIQEID